MSGIKNILPNFVSVMSHLRIFLRTFLDTFKLQDIVSKTFQITQTLKFTTNRKQILSKYTWHRSQYLSLGPLWNPQKLPTQRVRY